MEPPIVMIHEGGDQRNLRVHYNWYGHIQVKRTAELLVLYPFAGIYNM